MELSAQPVAHQFADHAVALAFAEFLNSMANVAHMIAAAHGVDPDIEGGLGGLEEFFDFWRHLAHFKGVGMVAIEVVHQYAAVD